MGYTLYWRTDPDREPISDLELFRALEVIEAFCTEHSEVVRFGKFESCYYVSAVDPGWPIETFRFGRAPQSDWQTIADKRPELLNENRLDECLPHYVRDGRIRY